MSKWPRRKLSEVLRIQNGFAFDSKRFTTDGGMPLIRIRDLKNGLSTETNFDGPFDQRYLVRKGEFLIGMDGEFGCFEWRGADALLNQRVCKLTDFAAGIEPRFLFYGINSYLKEIEDITTFTTVKHLSSKQIAAIEFPLPPLEEQRWIVAVLDEAFAAIATATANAEKKLGELAKLKQSLLHRAFSGDLTEHGRGGSVLANDYSATPEFAAQLLAFAHSRHVARGSSATFGHVKAQKTLHAVEALGGLDLGRQPIRDAAGPNDFAHMRRAEEWAKQHGFFEFVQRTSGGYDFRPLQNYGKLIAEAKQRIGQARAGAVGAIELLVDMDSTWAEIVMTTHAAWNNLILDSVPITDDAIVRAARDDWHSAKLRHDPSRFHDAIRFIRQNDIEPDGSAKRVVGQESLPL